MANYYTTNDMSIDMIEVDKAMMLLPPWMSTAITSLWDEGWVNEDLSIFSISI